MSVLPLDESVRVKFAVRRVRGGVPEAWRELSDLLTDIEKCGCFPTAPDGRMTGNAACRHADGLVVTRSGRLAGQHSGEDFTVVKNFDAPKWTATFSSIKDGAEPSSDTPLHWAALVEAPGLFGWKRVPRIAVHGHALSAVADAKRLGLPVSSRVTVFSTPEDREALLELFREYPYPEHDAYVRLGHGFFVLADDVAGASRRVHELLGGEAIQPARP